jgi:TolB-like protein
LNLIAELRRRNVIRMAGLYLVGAWLLTQVASTVLPAFEVPGWALRAVIIVLALGFVPALIFAWVFELTPEGVKRDADVNPEESIRPQTAQRMNRMIIAVLVLALVYFGVDKFVLAPQRGADSLSVAKPESRASSTAASSSSEPHAMRSIAVLPLDNYSGDPAQDYFAEGMTDELTTELATISQLRVISRSSTMQFKGEHRPPTPEIAKMLDVDAVVEGSVLRAGDKVRVTAQLIDARADRHLWAHSFERNSQDVLALQDELASAIAHEIDVRLTPGEKSRLADAPRVNAAAHDAYLKGRYFFNRPSDENLAKAIALFEEAVKLDPNFAPAYSGLSDAYLWAAFNEGVITATEAKPKTKAAAERAIQLNEASAEGHTSLAVYKSWFEFDWAGSEREFRRAFELNPNYAFAHDQFGLVISFQGRHDESQAEIRRAAELDPLDPQIPIDGLMGQAWQGKFQAAREAAGRAAELDPTFFFAPWGFGWIDIQEGKVGDAIPEFLKAKAMEAPPFVTAWLGYAYAAAGDKTRALAMIEEIKKSSLQGYVPPFNLAIVYLGLGDRAQALDYLERADAADSQWLIYIGGDRIFDPLRSDPRFVTLMRKKGFGK